MKVLMISAVLGLAALAGQAQAQGKFPEKPVTLIVPYAPGGTTDLLGRQLAAELADIWGQPVVVENRSGAGSMIGTAHLAQSQPDGYTLLLNTPAHVTAPAVYDDLPFDPAADITSVAMLSYSPFLMVAGSSVSAETLEELVEEAKSGEMFIATSGLGSSSHFAGELFASESGSSIDIVHFNGGGEALSSLMGAHAELYISSAASSMAAVSGGQVKPIAVLGSERYSKLSDTQATSEAGIEIPDIRIWQGIFGPGGMPDDLVQKIAADVATVLKSEEFLAMLDSNYTMPANVSSAEFSKMVADEMVFWKELAQRRGIKRE